MLSAEEILIDGESLQGYYNIEIARWGQSGWSGTVPPLYAMLTDQRIILQPQTRKRYQPAIIPRKCIRSVKPLPESLRQGLLISLNTDMHIGMFIPGTQAQALMRELRTATVPPSPVQFEEKIELGDLEKIITFVKNL